MLVWNTREEEMKVSELKAILDEMEPEFGDKLIFVYINGRTVSIEDIGFLTTGSAKYYTIITEIVKGF